MDNLLFLGNKFINWWTVSVVLDKLMGLLINLAVFKNGCEVERVICANDEKIIFFVFVTWNSDVLHTYYMLF